MYILENEDLQIKVNSIGAELASIVKKESQKEYVWQGDPTIWGSQAPVLFPIIGGLKNGVYTYKNQTYSLPKHGFIRYNEALEIVDQSATQLCFRLESSEKTKKGYPFDFRFEIDFELVENQLIVSHVIENTGGESMYFSVGGHPAFNCPLNDQEKYEDYYIRLDDGVGADAYVLSKEGVITDNTITVVEENRIQLTPTLFDNDALIFKNINAGNATLVHSSKGPVLSMRFSDFPDLGIWAKPKAPFICIEPWLGYADVQGTNQQLADKEGIQVLEAGAIHRSSYQIEIL